MEDKKKTIMEIRKSLESSGYDVSKLTDEQIENGCNKLLKVVLSFGTAAKQFSEKMSQYLHTV